MEYLLGLREVHHHLQTPKGGTNDAVVGDIVIVHDDIPVVYGNWEE